MKLINIKLNKQLEESAPESKPWQKAGKNQVVDYLKHLGMLSVALGCAISANATPLPATVARTSEASTTMSLSVTAAHSSLDRLLAQAESSKAGEFAVFKPWYFEAWPESTGFKLSFVQFINNDVNSAPQPQIDSLAGLLEEVTNNG